MIKIHLKTQTCSQNYLRNLEHLAFENLGDLIFKIFENHHLAKTDLDDFIYEMLLNLGYEKFTDIPHTALKKIAASYFHPDHQKLKDYDSERESYLLLANILSGNIITFIDDEILTDVQAPIALHHDSIISFIDKNKIQAIQFTTI